MLPYEVDLAEGFAVLKWLGHGGYNSRHEETLVPRLRWLPITGGIGCIKYSRVLLAISPSLAKPD